MKTHNGCLQCTDFIAIYTKNGCLQCTDFIAICTHNGCLQCTDFIAIYTKNGCLQYTDFIAICTHNGCLQYTDFIAICTHNGCLQCTDFIAIYTKNGCLQCTDFIAICTHNGCLQCTDFIAICTQSGCLQYTDFVAIYTKNGCLQCTDFIAICTQSGCLQYTDFVAIYTKNGCLQCTDFIAICTHNGCLQCTDFIAICTQSGCLQYTDSVAIYAKNECLQYTDFIAICTKSGEKPILLYLEEFGKLRLLVHRISAGAARVKENLHLTRPGVLCVLYQLLGIDNIVECIKSQIICPPSGYSARIPRSCLIKDGCFMALKSGCRRTAAPPPTNAITLNDDVFIIFVIWLYKKYIAFSQRLILYMTIAGFSISIAYLMGDLHPDGPLCEFQAFWMQLFQWGVLTWISCITFNLFVNVVWQRHTEQYECNKVSTWQGTYDPDTERNKQMLKEDIKPLRLYPFVYLAISIFPIINRIQNAVDAEHPVFSKRHCVCNGQRDVPQVNPIPDQAGPDE
ncbi:hypothetical protein MAR_012982 [Mya arenaria]|uniref:G-protein coupled receptors family 2 profile 2 domain-containing protein n=1 Tax=Mya arenaria TaxID=6604 RepID=A0ABY7G2C5_MYAAR|nr:hypothetical protein MAR_012982 [Mya arenaria]